MKTLIIALMVLFFTLPLNANPASEDDADFTFVRLGCPMYLVKSDTTWRIFSLFAGETITIFNPSPITINLIVLNSIKGGRDSIEETGEIDGFDSVFLQRSERAKYIAFSSDEEITLLTECSYE